MNYNKQRSQSKRTERIRNDYANEKRYKLSNTDYKFHHFLHYFLAIKKQKNIIQIGFLLFD